MDVLRTKGLHPHEVRALSNDELRKVARDEPHLAFKGRFHHYQTHTVEDARRVFALRLVPKARGGHQALTKRALADADLRGAMLVAGTRRQRRAAAKAHNLLSRDGDPGRWLS